MEELAEDKLCVTGSSGVVQRFGQHRYPEERAQGGLSPATCGSGELGVAERERSLGLISGEQRVSSELVRAEAYLPIHAC